MPDQTEEYHRVMNAARRLRATLDTAREEGYYRDAWYAYMNRRDIEVLVDSYLGPDPNYEPPIWATA